METKKKTSVKPNREKKRLKKLKVLIIILIVVAVLTVAQLIVLGMFGGIGPFGFLREKRMNKLQGNSEEYSFSVLEEMEDSPLKGGKICVLGASIADGLASKRTSVGEYLSARFGTALVKEAVDGTTMSTEYANNYIERMKTIDPNENFDIFIVQLSTNDASKKCEMGEISETMDMDSMDTATVTGAMEYIILYIQETWDCPVVFFTDAYFDNSNYDAMVSRLLELQEKYGIGVLNLWDNEEFNSLSEEQREIYMYDSIHPTMAGIRDWWGPEMEKQLLDYLQQTGQ